MMRPARKRVVTHRRLLKHVARLHTDAILTTLAKLGAAAGPQALQWFMPHAWPAFDLAKADEQIDQLDNGRPALRRFHLRNDLLGRK